MQSLADVKRESQGNRPIYFNDEKKGISLGVPYFGLGEIFDAAEGALDLVKKLCDSPETDDSGAVILVRLALEYIIKCQSDLFPVADKSGRRFFVEHYNDGSPMAIALEKGGAK